MWRRHGLARAPDSVGEEPRWFEGALPPSICGLAEALYEITAENAVFTVMANGTLNIAVAGVKKHPVNWLWSR